MVALHPINTDAEYAAVPTTPSLLVLYFHAPWASPCAQMSTVLTHLASTYPDTAPIAFYSVDAEELPDIAEDHHVEAVPHIALKRDGKIIDTVSGADAVKVRATIERHMNPAQSSKASLPPQQTVTRPPPPEPSPQVTNGVETATTAVESTGAANQPVKNLSGYAPSASDPPTAPAMSSTATDTTTSQEDLNRRLSELVKAAPVMLFMKGTPSAPQCGFSRQLVSILRENGVRYGFFNILADEEVRQGLKTFSDWPTFPQLYMSGELVGGLDIVKEEMENDQDFFKGYVAETKRNAGGPAAPKAQAAPAVGA